MLPADFRITLGCMCVPVVVTNGCVCLLVYMYRSLRSYTNGIVVSLAVSDILTGAVLLPLQITVPEFEEVSGYIVCIIMLTGVANVVAVTLDRYLAIKRPFDYLAVMQRHFIKLIVSSWAIPIAIAIIPLSFNPPQNKLAYTIYLSLLQLLCVIVPYVFVFVAYCRIFHRARTIVNRLRRESSISWHKDEKRTGRKNDTASEAKVAKMFSVIAVSFILSWMPVIYLTSVLAAVGKLDTVLLDQLSPSWLRELSLVTIALGSMVNPIIYCFFKPDFRRILKRVLRRYAPKRKKSGSEKLNTTLIVEKLESGDGGPETDI
ncbi:adenosine receptor A2a-like [Montipora foliosa]|uniref:adenosine receptor A2a-like n=1 Tax=Montipora foliosa TaxID=591990 RepID=UPI0035F181EC